MLSKFGEEIFLNCHAHFDHKTNYDVTIFKKRITNENGVKQMIAKILREKRNHAVQNKSWPKMSF